MEASLPQYVRVTLFVAAWFFSVSSGQAVVIWDEAVNGDLADTGNAATSPNDFILAAGTSTVKGTMPTNDFDFLTIFIPEDHEFTGLVLQDYVSTDGISFIGMKAGEILNRVTASGDPMYLLGYAHFGTTPGNIDEDILPDMGAGYNPGEEAQGFTPPLPTGAYTFWIQQASTAATSFEFDFIMEAIEEPDPVLIGDYNGDEKVSAADFTVWRDNLGAETLTNRDPENEGAVDVADFESWKEHYGEVPEGSGAGLASVPEPSGMALALLLAITMLASRGKLN